jgi:plasmid stabilization system protein ParE
MTAYQGYELHPEAYEDVDEIRGFLAADNADAADRVVIEIFNALERLVSFPHQGHRRPDLTSRPVRFIRVRDHLIAYAPDEKPLWIIAVMHGHRSPRVMAAILRGREEPRSVLPSA